MAAYPDTAQPHDIHSGLIDAVYRAIQDHPDPDVMAEYGSFLPKLLARQAKIHAAANQARQHGLSGGPQAEPDPGTGAQPGQVVASLTGGPSFYGAEPPANPLATLIAERLGHGAVA